MEGGNLTEARNKDLSDRLNKYRVNSPMHDPAIHRSTFDDICGTLLLAIHIQAPRKSKVLERFRT